MRSVGDSVWAERVEKIIGGDGHIQTEGYRRLLCPLHPDAQYGYVYEHRAVASAAAGRLLEPGEHVHHKNGDKLDNRPENLEILSVAEHRQRHVGVTDERVAELLRSGMSGKKIAVELGVSTHRVVRVRREYGIGIVAKSGKPFTFDRRLAAKMRAEGLSYAEIGRRFSVSTSAVSMALSRHDRLGEINAQLAILETKRQKLIDERKCLTTKGAAGNG